MQIKPQIRISLVAIVLVLLAVFIQNNSALNSGNAISNFQPQPRYDTIVIYPVFTELAYQKNGFYDYYSKACDTKCLVVRYHSPNYNNMAASRAAYNFFNTHGYTIVSDMIVTDHPEILKLYRTVIVLHNEYVSQKEFDAITNHTHVLYLYPNALYAEVEYDKDTSSIYLVKGHGWPSDIKNGFGWVDDNSKYESDKKCDNWKIIPAHNGIMISCYPEYIISGDDRLTKLIMEY